MEPMKRTVSTIFIVGTTAVGKTKLSVKLAKRYNGEVISCDSKQLYKHASIMTAKVTTEQAEGIPHHLVDFLPLAEQAYNRNQYYEQATRIIKEIRERGRLPIIVGGTSYYLQPLLYALNLSRNEPTKQKSGAFDHLSKEEKYALLKMKDPLMAEKVHENDEKRLSNFLDKCQQTGTAASSSYTPYCNELRDPNTVLFWLRNSDKDQLLSTVSTRIDKMLAQGGLCQILAVYSSLQMTKQLIEGSITNGIASSIGIRQFQCLYHEVRDELTDVLGRKDADYPEVHALISDRIEQIKAKLRKETLSQCSEQLKINTKNYCKRQITWLRNRIFVDSPATRSHLFTLELSQAPNQQPFPLLERFTRQAEAEAISIIDTIEKKGFGSVQGKDTDFAKGKVFVPIEEWKKYECKVCDRKLNGPQQWEIHLESKRHILAVKREQRRPEIEELKKRLSKPIQQNI